MSVVALGVGLVVGDAVAATGLRCGKIDPETGEPAKAVLTIEGSQSVITHAFERDTAPAQLSLTYIIKGCRLVEPLRPSPSLRVRPVSDLDQLPSAALSAELPEVDGSELTLIVNVKPGAFEPGTYGAGLSLRAPAYLEPNYTRISVSRSEDWKQPLALSFLGALTGFAWIVLGKWLLPKATRIDLAIGWPRLFLAGIFVIATGVVAAFGSYWDQTVWSFDDNGKSTVILAFTAATAGSVVAAITSGGSEK